MRLRTRALLNAKKSQAKKHSQKTPPLKRREAERRQAHPPRAASKRDAARVLSPFLLVGGPRPPGPHGAGALAFRRPNRGTHRGFYPRLGSGRASWNHRMQTGGPSPAPVQRAPRSPARAGRDDAQAARKRSVSPRPREPPPLRPKEYPRERRPSRAGCWLGNCNGDESQETVSLLETHRTLVSI
jgi:hypothetical protein